MFVNKICFSAPFYAKSSFVKKNKENNNGTLKFFQKFFHGKIEDSIENKWQNNHHPFYEKRPIFSKWPKMVRERYVEALEANSNDFLGLNYSPEKRWLLSSRKRNEVDPAYLWRSLKSPKNSEIQNPSILTHLKEKNNNIRPLFHAINNTLKEKSNLRLTNLSHEDLDLIWKNFRYFRNYDAMVEIFDCCLPSKFTATNSVLSDYAFAHLVSPYCRPTLSLEFAERLAMEEKNSPEIKYLLGLSLHTCARIAKEFAIQNDHISKYPMDLLILQTYKLCFPFASCEDSHNISSKSFEAADLELKNAFFAKPNAVFALGYILNLIDREQLDEAKKWSSFVWNKLSLLEDLTLYQARVSIIVGIIAEKPIDLILSRLKNCQEEIEKSKKIRNIKESKEILDEHLIKDSDLKIQEILEAYSK